MKQTMHFISGLPRSGSTLLAAILRQNPRFHAGMTSPVAALIGALMQQMSGGGEFSTFFNDEKRRDILQGLFQSYYYNQQEKHVVFDTNRTWTSKMALIDRLYPQSRVICCVRDVSWIIDSLERIVRQNALQPSRIFNYKSSGTVYSRVDTLMNPETGLIGLAWSSLREAWFGDYAHRLVIVSYDHLVNNPAGLLANLYDVLGESSYHHDFDNVTYDEPAYDADLGLPGLHKVRQKIEFSKRDSCIPPDIFNKYAETNFWKNPNLNLRGVTIL